MTDDQNSESVRRALEQQRLYPFKTTLPGVDPPDPGGVREHLWGLLAGCVTTIVLAALSYWLQFVPNVWPSIGYCGGAEIVLAYARRRTNPWMKAAAALLIPVVLGFGVLVVVQGVINGMLTNDSLDQPVRDIEYGLLFVFSYCPTWATESWPKLIILAGLVSLTRLAPSAKLVTRYVWLSKHLGHIAGALACATAFSFFTNDPLLGQWARNAEAHVTTSLERGREDERRHIGTYLARRIVRDRSTITNHEAMHVAALMERLLRSSGLTGAVRRDLAHKIGQGFARPSGDSSSARENSPPPSRPDLRHVKALVEAQEAKTVAAASLAGTDELRVEEVAALEEALKTAHEDLRDPLKTLCKEFLKGLVAAMSPTLAELTTLYLDKVVDEHLDPVTEPLIHRSARQLHNAIEEDAARGLTPGSETLFEKVLSAHVVAVTERALGRRRVGLQNGDLQAIAEADKEIEQARGIASRSQLDIPIGLQAAMVARQVPVATTPRPTMPGPRKGGPELPGRVRVK